MSIDFGYEVLCIASMTVLVVLGTGVPCPLHYGTAHL